MTDLVLQAPVIRDRDLAAIAELARPREVRLLSAAPIPAARGPVSNEAQPGTGAAPVPSPAHAYRLLGVNADASVAGLCAAARIDHAYVPPTLVRGRVRLVATDMDSTLITIECIDEIADLLDLKPQVAAITAAAMRGEIDFAESLVRRVGLLAGLPATGLQRVYDERLRLSPGAERMLEGFVAVGATTLLVSGGFTFFTDRLRARLGIDEAAANTLEIADGRLSGRLLGPIVDAQAKAARLIAMRQRVCGDGGIAVAIGDGANDLPMLKAADVSIAYRAMPSVRAQATFAIDHCGLDAVLNLFA